MKESRIELEMLWPKEIQQHYNILGSKIHIFWVKYLDGAIEIAEDEINNYKWLSKTEFFQVYGTKFPKQREQLIEEYRSLM